MADVDGHAVGRSTNGKIVLAFFDETEYKHGANISPEKALEVAHDIQRKAEQEIKEAED